MELTQFFLDRHRISLKTRARAGFAFLMTTRGAWWIWSTLMQTKYKSTVALDWADTNFGRALALYVLLGASFQTHYLFLYFLVQNGEVHTPNLTLMIVVKTKADAPRAAGLLRAVESAVCPRLRSADPSPRRLRTAPRLSRRSRSWAQIASTLACGESRSCRPGL